MEKMINNNNVTAKLLKTPRLEMELEERGEKKPTKKRKKQKKCCKYQKTSK
jgi:hypothetical protein